MSVVPPPLPVSTPLAAPAVARPVVGLVLGIICLFFGAIGSLMCVLNFFLYRIVPQMQQMYSQEQFFLTQSIGVVLALLEIPIGIGLIMAKQWARVSFLLWAFAACCNVGVNIAFLLNTGNVQTIAGGVAGAVVGLAFPIVGSILLLRNKTRQAFEDYAEYRQLNP